MPSKGFKTTNRKIPHLRFFRFFQTISDKNYGKNRFLDNFLFLPPPPHPPLNNVEKQRAKLVSSYVMDSQHCIGGERGFLNRLFEIPITFCH